MTIPFADHTDTTTAKITFGCMSLDLKDRDECIRLLREAVDAGITHFDTADLYDKGLNESVVGEALSSVRDQVSIATKVGNQWREDGSGWDWNASKEYILQAVDHSLRRLGTETIDLYQLHGGTTEDNIDETIEAFERLIEQGKIRSYGISSIRPNVIREWVRRSTMSSVMMQYSMLDRRPEESCLDLLYENNISVITRGSLAKGLLVNKPAGSYLGYSESDVELVQDELRKTGSPLSYALQYVWRHKAVRSSAVGIRTREQLLEVAEATKTKVDVMVLERLVGLLKPNTYDTHR